MKIGRKNQCVERLHLEENEDKDDKEFSYNCLDTAKGKIKWSVGGLAAKKSKEPTKKNFKCDNCERTTGIKYNLKRHIECYKHKSLEFISMNLSQ